MALRPADGTNLSLLSYAYDNDDNITGITDGVTPANDVADGYDVRGRLSQVGLASTSAAPFKRTDYAHDANGNRSSVERRVNAGAGDAAEADSYARTPGTNRITSIATPAVTRNLGYDSRGNLATETRGAGVTATTAYDGHGRLISTSFGGDDGIGGYMPIAVATTGGTLTYVHGDHLGTPIVMTDAAGTAIAQPAGYFTPAFPGQSQTLPDLYYNRYRDYDPTTGRYIQADPIGFEGGASPYRYAVRNPVRYVDPTGEFVPILVGVAIGAGFEYFTNDCATASDIILAGALGGIGGGFCGAATLRYGPRAQTRVMGKEWSHAIPRNWVKKFPRWAQKSMNRRGGYNGSWVDPKRHL